MTIELHLVDVLRRSVRLETFDSQAL